MTPSWRCFPWLSWAARFASSRLSSKCVRKCADYERDESLFRTCSVCDRSFRRLYGDRRRSDVRVGIVISLWLILAAFELAALYGAVKIMNPLGERCRAAFLVSSILQLLFFLGMAFLLKGDIANGPLSGLFWIGLAVSSVLSIAAFVLARMRRTIVALAALYIATFFSVSLFVAGLSSKLQGASTPDPMVMAVITGWTIAVLLWRLYRKRVVYEWKDHI